jgi:inner membrane protein YidH
MEGRSQPAKQPDAPRRTQLAAERTWLAWWRTGLAAAAGAIGIGRLLPELVDGATWPYAVLGTGYGVLALALMGAAAVRQGQLRNALRRDGYEELSDAWVLAFTAAGMVLTVLTIVLVVAA